MGYLGPIRDMSSIECLFQELAMCISGSEIGVLVIISKFYNSEDEEYPGKALYRGFSVCRDTCDSIYVLGICKARDSQSPLP